MRRPVEGPAIAAYPRVVETDRVDIVALHAPAGKATPSDVVDLLHLVKCSVLVFRNRDVVS